MRRSIVRRGVGGAVLAALVAAGVLAANVIAGGAPASTSQGAAAASDAAVHLRIGLQRFQVAKNHKRLVARGNVVATYTANGKTQASTTKAVTLAVQATGTCRVLHLELGELDLSLLGLIVTLTPVDAPSITLDITADSSEALGKLLCQVINAVQGATIQPTAKLHRLNSAVKKKYSGGIANFDIPLNRKSGAATTTDTTSTTSTTGTTTTTSGPAIPAGQCEVLALVLGPLHLDLLGLIVDLNKIQLHITANPVGTLGTLFCQLAGSTVSTTSTTSTAASTSTTTTVSTTT
jgi:hypothetical protein